MKSRISAWCLLVCLCVSQTCLLSPQADTAEPLQTYGPAYGSLSAPSLYVQHTQTKMLRKLHSRNVAMQETVAWCKQVDRTTPPTQNPPALSGLSGSSEQNQTQARSPLFRSLFSFNRDETFHFISLIDSGRSMTHFGLLSLQFDLRSCLSSLVLHNQWVCWTLMNLWQPCRHRNLCFKKVSLLSIWREAKYWHILTW